MIFKNIMHLHKRLTEKNITVLISYVIEIFCFYTVMLYEDKKQ